MSMGRELAIASIRNFFLINISSLEFSSLSRYDVNRLVYKHLIFLYPIFLMLYVLGGN